MTKLAMLVLLVCMLIMYCQSYSFPKAIPNPKPQDVGKTNNDFIGTLLSSDRDGDFFPVNANENLSGWKQVCNFCACGNNRRGETGYRAALGSATSLEQCELKCIDTPGCKAVEYWEGSSECFNCIRPSKHEDYYDYLDAAHPVSIHQQGQEKSRFKCYGWTKNDLKQIRQGGSSIDIQKKTCEERQNFVFSQGVASKAPGCGGCWCCQPDN